MWSAALRKKKCQKLDFDVGLEGKYRSVGYGKQYLLVWSCVEERGWSCLEKGIKF